MDLLQIIYASQPLGYDEAVLKGILMDARRCNGRDGITGALVCRRDIYLQLLEGPEDKVRDAYARIREDDRHLEVELLVARPVTERKFGDWEMLHDPARSWLWCEEELAGGVLERATEAELIGVFDRLLERIRTEGQN